jgi:hypothetical protein
MLKKVTRSHKLSFNHLVNKAITVFLFEEIGKLSRYAEQER